ncbi:MAG TPA: class I SAM-dependent methyltransferase, partial [Chlamydiales bacterium]|nr:class I SAM-dependent methyltransferase [Chlamydiales bacterium]
MTLPLIKENEDKNSPFINCIRKNYRHIRKWANRTNTNAFRIYDRHMHHYPLAIDYYDGRFCIQYFSPYRDDPEPPEAVVNEVEQCLKVLFGAEPAMIFWRSRIRRAKHQQYEKLHHDGDKSKWFPILEYGVKFKINLLDYLDTGLFLDHRETRRMVASYAQGKRLLNLFAYTCSFSVHAAVAGASYTKSVDMSNTYTDWGRENFVLNDLSTKNNPIIRADCLKFLDEEREKYDIIVIDPPTISRSKKMDQMFDIQLDYPMLLTKALKLLAPNGLIFFSTNSRKFLFEPTLFPPCTIVEMSHRTLPIDFHDPK